jgi:prevent-host-death family protein
MKKASITEAKNNLSSLIDGLKSGSPVLIVDRGRPVARLEPIITEDNSDGRLSRLVRDGIVRLGTGALPGSVLADLPPRAKGSASAVQALLAERLEGR